MMPMTRSTVLAGLACSMARGCSLASHLRLGLTPNKRALSVTGRVLLFRNAAICIAVTICCYLPIAYSILHTPLDSPRRYLRI